MIDQGILKGAPKGATHFSWDGHYLKYDINRVLEIYHVNYKHWQQASTWIGVDRSLDDIKRITELEKEMDGICLAVLNNRGKSVTERTLVRVRGVVDKFNLPLNIL